MSRYDHICPEARFLADVAEHELIIVRDDGVNRHIRFKKQGTSCMHFDLITWPGYLCYTGDMGTFVFSRLEDMFEFFRTDREHMRMRDGQTLAINPGYWGQKLQALDRGDGMEKWSEEKFQKLAIKDFDEWLADGDLSDEEKEDARQQFAEEVIGPLCFCGKEEAYRNMINFEFNDETPFKDWWEVNTDEYSFRFIWGCYALAWGVAKYDAAGAE